MRNANKGLALGAALSSASLALAQTTTTTGLDLSNLLGGGAVGLIVLAVLVFLAWRWWGGSGN